MKLKLDPQAIAGLALGEGKVEEFAWDSELEGFGLRLRRRRDGSLLRSWAAQYRANGRTRRVTLGAVEKVNAIEARAAARKVLAGAVLGNDPQAERKAKRVRAARSFRAVVEAYLAAKRPELRPISYRITKLYLTGSYFRPLHAIGIAEIGHADIAARISAVTREHSSHTAAAARRALSALFRWAMEEGWITSNPVVGTRRPTEVTPRDRVLTPSELGAIWNALGDDDHGRILRLLMLLGARRQEIGGMRWSEIDLDAGTWALPRERSKNHRAHTVVLPPTALAIIQFVPRTDRDPLFGDRSDTGFTRWTQDKRELDQRLGDRVGSWRVHDIRRSVATHMAEIGIEPHHIEACLNHYSGHRAGIAGVYNRAPYERQIKTALARWDEHLMSLVEGRNSKVVQLSA